MMMAMVTKGDNKCVGFVLLFDIPVDVQTRTHTRLENTTYMVSYLYKMQIKRDSVYFIIHTQPPPHAP